MRYINFKISVDDFEISVGRSTYDKVVGGTSPSNRTPLAILYYYNEISGGY